jgi:hypothetical protein
MNPAACVLGGVLIACLAACGNTPGQQAVVSSSAASSSPTPDAATQKYVALIRSYWAGIQDADQFVNGFNLAAKVCHGDSPSAPSDLQRIDPALCRQRAVAILANQEKFLGDLAATPPPPRFAADDAAFRTQVPKAISDAKAMISACGTGNKQTIFDATTAYINDMIPTVTGAMDDVDPTVRHS